MFWNDERDRYIRDNRGKLSSQQMGDHLGCSRNAVIGRAHRLGLEKIPRPEGANNGTRIANIRRARIKNNKQPKLNIIFNPPPPPIIDTEIPVGQRKSLIDLNPRDCRWPVGDPCVAGFFFCGGDALSGHSYCAAHHHRAHDRSEPIIPFNYRRKAA